MLFLVPNGEGYPTLEILLACPLGELKIEVVSTYEWRRTFAIEGTQGDPVECRLNVQRDRRSAKVTVSVVTRTKGPNVTETISEEFVLNVLSPEELALPKIARPSPAQARTLEEYLHQVLQSQKTNN